MTELSIQTTQMLACLERMKAGDREAREELLRRITGRMEKLARKMLRGFPDVRQFEQTDDVLQHSLLRLVRSLESVTPGSMRDFFNLAAVHIRRELLDLARHYRGPHGMGPNQMAPGRAETENLVGDQAVTHDTDDVERWCAFHEEVERLPANEREVVSLIFYHDWPQADVAQLFQVDERTIRRWWQAARLKLHAKLRQFDVV